MKSGLSRYICVFIPVFFLSAKLASQVCNKDSNFYSITYRGPDRNQITYATPVSNNEVVTLTRQAGNSDFITKFTSQGQVIWSNAYIPDYPFDYWWQYPWYERTKMEGMVTGNDSTLFVYGSTIEHGTTLNGAGPPTHQAGLLYHLDKFGNLLSGKYLGNWLTDYSVNSLIQLRNGNLVVYMQSHFPPYISKLICMSQAGDLIWGTALQTNYLYSEVSAVNPVMKELSNGNIIVANEMLRTLDDTLHYPFLPAIIVPAPLYYFHFLTVQAGNGRVLEENSYQCPPLSFTNVTGNFLPRMKHVTELPGGKLSFLADMYLPVDSVVFYKQRVYSRSIANIITNMEGGFLKQVFYRPQNGAAILQNGFTTGNVGEQTILGVDSSNQQQVLFKVGADHQVLWTKSYVNAISSAALSGMAVEKQDHKGYFIFQSDPELVNFHLGVTNATGNDPCTEVPAPEMLAQQFPWPWFANKVYLNTVPLDIDFRISPFKFAKRYHPLTGQTNCQYQEACCTDFIDSLHLHNVTICENGNYTLPDNTVVRDSGVYYATLKTIQGCDSIVYYNIKVLKSPNHLTATPDTCLEGNAVIQLRALEGYDTYWWNNSPTQDAYYNVHAPGTYTVRVDNICGTKTTAIIVYDHCDFPIYFPSAFTPNGDYLNDVLNVPYLNKNKLVRLSVFNRAGQVVFSTRDPNDGWDGSIKGLPQPSGLYVYFLEMKGLSGDKLTQKGTVLLIR